SEGIMKRSTDRFLTTHVGSLPRPPDLLAMLLAREQGEPVDQNKFETRLRAAVAEIVRQQTELGIDVVDDGEFGKPGFVNYINERLGGFEIDKRPEASPWANTREALSFPEFYAETSRAASQRIHMVCTGPIVYRGQAALARDIANLKAALDCAAEAFMPA